MEPNISIIDFPIQNQQHSSKVESDAEKLRVLLAAKPRIRNNVDTVISAIKRRHLESSLEVTQELLKLTRLVVATKRWDSAHDLLCVVRALGRRFVRTRPTLLVIGNVFHRVIHTIKEEYVNILKSQDGQNESSKKSQFLFDLGGTVLPLWELGSQDVLEKLITRELPEGSSLSGDVSSAISEMLNELENIGEPINKQATDHIHADDVVLIFGKSRIIAEFLSAANRKRKFKVIVCEAAPECSGHAMALELAKLGVTTTLIPDGNVFALLPTVNKVFLGTHAVMANGGLICPTGSHLVAQAAKHHSVPVICVTGLYKLCPLFPHNQDAFIELKSPGLASSYADFGGFDNVQVVSPSVDYIPPELVSLLVTDTGGHQPSYVYRLLAESYDINAEEDF